jgi:hypothetical protein
MKVRDHEALVGDLLHGVLKAHPAFSANPIGDWSELVGEQVARYSQPKSLKKGVLTVIAFDSVWKHHLELNKEALVAKINGKRPEPIVEEISIRVGEVPGSAPVLNPYYKKLNKIASSHSHLKRKKKAPLRQLTPEERDLIKNLPDKELRTLATRLLRRVQDNPTSD